MQQNSVSAAVAVSDQHDTVHSQVPQPICERRIGLFPNILANDVGQLVCILQQQQISVSM